MPGFVKTVLLFIVEGPCDRLRLHSLEAMLTLRTLILTLALFGGITSVIASGGEPGKYDLSFPEGVSVSQNTIYIPFRMVGRLVAVQARVDTVEGLFFLDTGASDLLLNERYFERETMTANREAIGAAGSLGTLAIRKVDTLFWDALEITDLEGHVVSLQQIEDKKKTRVIGILGFPVFKDYEVLIDYSIRQLIVTRTDKKGVRLDPDAIFQRPVDSLEFRLIGHTIVIRGEINGVKVKLGLDTGAELNLLDAGVKRKALDNFEILRRTTMTGAGTKEVEVIAGVLYGLTMDIEQTIGMRTLLTKMWRVNDAMGTDLDGVLGYEFLFNKRTLINYKKEKLYFFPPIKS